MIHYIAQTSFMSWWERQLAMWGSTYVVKEYGDKSFHVYQVCRIFGLIAMPDVRLSVHTSLDDACAWCEKQINDSKVKSVTYVMED